MTKRYDIITDRSLDDPAFNGYNQVAIRLIYQQSNFILMISGICPRT